MLRDRGLPHRSPEWQRRTKRGQTLVEVVIAVAIATAVVTALALASSNAIRNAQFSKNQSRATKLAQEAIEVLRSYRDRYGFDALRRCKTNTVADGTPEYLTITNVNVPGSFNTGAACYFERVSLAQQVDNYLRQVEVTTPDNNTVYVKVWVSWVDAQGNHGKFYSEPGGSALETQFTRWKY